MAEEGMRLDRLPRAAAGANLISIAFQNNINLGYGPDNGVQNILNIQPV